MTTACGKREAQEHKDRRTAHGRSFAAGEGLGPSSERARGRLTRSLLVLGSRMLAIRCVKGAIDTNWQRAMMNHTLRPNAANLDRQVFPIRLRSP